MEIVPKLDENGKSICYLLINWCPQNNINENKRDLTFLFAVREWEGVEVLPNWVLL